MEKQKPSQEARPTTYTNPEGHIVRVIPEAPTKRVAVGRSPIKVHEPRVKHSEINHLDDEFTRNRRSGR